MRIETEIEEEMDGSWELTVKYSDVKRGPASRGFLDLHMTLSSAFSAYLRYDGDEEVPSAEVAT